jgi:pimeloyl-ACP methyl ester carboxylesterase
MKPLLLLHGALGSADQFDELSMQLRRDHEVHCLNFSGHGGNDFPEQDFSIGLFGIEVLNYMEEKKIESASFFGYSMGGYVAMYLAKKLSNKVDSVITLATKFHWDQETAAKEIKMLDAKTIEQKLPAFASQLEQRHAPSDWKLLLEKTSQLLHGLGRKNELKADDYRTINTPSLILLGDHDKMVTLEETVNIYKCMPNSQLGILPNTPHQFEGVDCELLATLIRKFLK